MYGVDTPEIRGKTFGERALAKVARDYVRDLLNNSEMIMLKDVRRGKYFRIVAEVYIDGESLGKKLLDEKLAVEYYGGTKKVW